MRVPVPNITRCVKDRLPHVKPKLEEVWKYIIFIHKYIVMFIGCVSCRRTCIIRVSKKKKKQMNLSQVEKISCGSDINTVIGRGRFKALRTMQTHRETNFGETIKLYWIHFVFLFFYNRNIPSFTFIIPFQNVEYNMKDLLE